MTFAGYRQVRLAIQDRCFSYRVYTFWGLRLVREEKRSVSDILDIRVQHRPLPFWRSRPEWALPEFLLMMETWGPEGKVYTLEIVCVDASFKTIDLFFMRKGKALKLCNRLHAAISFHGVFKQSFMPLGGFSLCLGLIFLFMAYTWMI